MDAHWAGGALISLLAAFGGRLGQLARELFYPYTQMKQKLKEAAMKKKTVIDRRSIALEHVLRADYIPLGGGRPHREAVIGSEDLINLKIALNTSKTFDDFLNTL
jgi:hypothetical protein